MIVSTFTDDIKFDIPETIKQDLQTFLKMVENDGLSTSELSKELGLDKEITHEEFANQLINAFNL